MISKHGQKGRYNYERIGVNSRLDTIQAAILIEKLKIFEEEIKSRNNVAKQYNQILQNSNLLKCPYIPDDNNRSVWAQYTIRVQERDLVQERLSEIKIPTAIYYPIPLHLQECFDYLNHKKGDFISSEKLSNECLSLPMNPYLNDEEIEFIASSVLSCVNA